MDATARRPLLPTSRLRRTLLLVVAAATLVLGLTACQPSYSGPAGAPKVNVVGDSFTEWGATEITGALSSYQRSVRGIAGIDLVRGRSELVQPAVATQPDVLVVELGVNSALDGWTGGDLVPLDGIIADVKPVPCVIWVTPDVVSSPFYDAQGPGTLTERIAQMRASITKRLPQHPNMHLADWGMVVRQRPEWISSNGLHLNMTGSEALGAYIAQQIDTLC